MLLILIKSLKSTVKFTLPLCAKTPLIGKYFNQLQDFYYEKRHQRQTNLHDIRLKPEIDRIISSKTNSKTIDLFTTIEIETLNRCNNTCPFCPVNRLIDPRPLAKMSDALFFRIIDQLSDLNYTGSLAIFSNNEPYIDPRLIVFLKYAKKKLPHAFHYLYTNGSLLTLEKFKSSMKYLDQLIIDNYNDNLELNPMVKPIYDFCQQHPAYLSSIKVPSETGVIRQPKVIFSMRKQHERLTTRGGQAKNRGKIKPLTSSCILPFVQLVIRPDGKVSLCCNDALGKMTLGDASHQTLTEIWYGSVYQAIRQKISSGRQYLPLCRFCDTLAVD